VKSSIPSTTAKFVTIKIATILHHPVLSELIFIMEQLLIAPTALKKQDSSQVRMGAWVKVCISLPAGAMR
jgi:hypothetical protein